LQVQRRQTDAAGDQQVADARVGRREAAPSGPVTVIGIAGRSVAHAAGADPVGLGEDRQARALGVQDGEGARVQELAAPGAAQHDELAGPGGGDGRGGVGLELEGEVAAAEPGVGRDARFKLSRGHAGALGRGGSARKDPEV
jgi:hypothetical protein